MATYDNKIWLLKNIRDAFIATDDTGLCEIVMGGEDFSKIFQNKAVEDRKRLKEALSQPGTSKVKDGMGNISEEECERDIVTQFDPYPDIDDSEEDEPCGSYERYDDVGNRQRSNTAQWLDKKVQALKKAAKIKVIKWEDPSPMTDEQVEEMFPKVEIVKPKKQKSLLGEQLENCPNLPHRQYLEYAKFDGTAQLGLPTKSFKIFMTMLPERHQNYPVVVCVIANAKIKDLIGFTCYKYSIEHPEIPLGSVHDYGLCMAEDDGEVDWGFPCLDSNEPCSKFGFTCLGLIELRTKSGLSSQPTNISIPEEGILRDSILMSRADNSGHSHQNSIRQHTGGSQTSEAVANAIEAVNKDRRSGGLDLNKIQSHIIAAEAPQYKVYNVDLVRKVRTNSPIQLIVSLDKIEVEPLVVQKSLWPKSKYLVHNIDSVAWCQLLETRGSRSTFRVVYSPSHNANYSDKNNSGNTSFFHANTNYKFHDFECEQDRAKEIVEKINTILDLRNSPCRREYKTAKEKKLHMRRSFQTKHMS